MTKRTTKTAPQEVRRITLQEDKRTPPQDEKRIYVILPETVQHRNVSYTLPAGMLIAQGEHVVSRMRMHQIFLLGFDPITTINLSVRNSAELRKVKAELETITGVTRFDDNNLGFYGTPDKILTAICTLPVTRSEVDSAIGHLGRYKAKGEL